MMLKEKSSPWARLKYLYVLPLAAIAITAFARPEVSTELDEISAVKVNDLTAIVKAEEVKSAEILSEDGIKVKGRVLDEEYSSGIIGANVLIKGSTIGTVTDEEGRFELPVEAGNVDSLLEFCQLVSHSSIEGNHRRSAVGRRAQCAEFKTVACKCEWRRTVAVGIVDKQFRNLRHVFQLHTLFCRECYVVVHIGVKQTVYNVCNLCAEKH